MRLILQPLTDIDISPTNHEAEKDASMRHGKQRSTRKASEKPTFAGDNTTTNTSREPATAIAVQLLVSDLTRIRCPVAVHNSDSRFQFIIMARDRKSNRESSNITNLTQSAVGHPLYVSSTNGGATRGDAAAEAKGETKIVVEGRELIVTGGGEAEAGCQVGQRQLREVAPFGVLSAESDEVLCALVLGAASVR